MSEQEILIQVKFGDPTKCLEYLYKVEFPKIRNYIKRNSGNEDDAKDVFQESLMTFFTYVKLGKFNESYQIGAFLFAIGRNSWKKSQGKLKETIEVNPELLQEINENYTYEYLFDKEKKAIIAQLFNQVGETCKQLFRLIIFEKQSILETSEQLGIGTAETVKVRYHRCKQKLSALVSTNQQLKNQLLDILKP